MTPEGLEALHLVEQALNNQLLYRYDPDLPRGLIILRTRFAATGVIWQKQGPLKWLHLPVSRPKVFSAYYDLCSQLIIKDKNFVKRYRFYYCSLYC